MRTNANWMGLCLSLFVGLLCAAVAPVSVSAADTAVWCAGESLKIQPATEPAAKSLTWNAETKTATLGSARNEYVAVQVAVKAGDADLKTVTVVPADLIGPKEGDKDAAKIPVANMDLFVEHYLDVKVSSRGDATSLMKQCKAGEWPTQMVPFSSKKYGAPFDVGAGRNQPVWVDIYVPENQTPGDYTGVFKVTADGKDVGSVNVKLTVWKFTLPQETHFHSFLYTGPEQLRWGFHTGSDWESDKFKAIEDQFFQMAHQHRLNFNINGGDAVNEDGGRYRKYYDGSAFTSRVGKGVGQNVMPLSVENADSKEQWESGAKRIVDFVEKNKFTAIVFTYVWDEPHSDADFKGSQQRCKWVHEAVGTKLSTYIATPQYDKYDAGDVNIFSEPDVKDIPKIVKRGDSVWAVNGGYGAGPYVDAPGYGGRSIVWMQWKLHLNGYQFWDCCYWVDVQNRLHFKNGKSRPYARIPYGDINADPEKYLTKLWDDPMNFDESRKQNYPIKDSIRINGDGLLYYPGYDLGVMGPIASFALKSFRRGAEDYEYIWLLKAKGVPEKDIDEVVNTVCMAPGAWNDDAEAWDAARLKLAEMLNK